MKSSYVELKRNSIIIAVANLGSKLIGFILAPLYSYYLSVSQYGTMELLSSAIGLLAPFVCLDVYEATFRYSNDVNYSKKKVLSSSLSIIMPGLLVCVLGTVLFSGNHTIIAGEYMLALFICIGLSAMNIVLAQFLRGSKKMLLFAVSGIVSAIVLLVSNLIFMVVMGKGLWGWVLSLIISKFAEFIYLTVASDFIHNFSFRDIDRGYIKEFLRFCLPLLPTASMWWIMNMADRYLLAFFIGTTATGIYAVANKIPSLLSVFENIFYQAWQTTAINVVDSEDRDNMYSEVFNNYLIILTIGVMGVLLLAKPLVMFLFEEDYFSAWYYIPILLFGVVIHALGGNLGSLYSVFRNTTGALISTVIGAVVNIVLNIIFIPIWGIMGASITTVVGYVITLLYRWFDVKKFVSIRLDIKAVLLCTAMMFVQMFLYYQNGIWSYGLRIGLIMLVLVLNKDVVLGILSKRGKSENNK